MSSVLAFSSRCIFNKSHRLFVHRSIQRNLHKPSWHPVTSVSFLSRSWKTHQCKNTCSHQTTQNWSFGQNSTRNLYFTSFKCSDVITVNTPPFAESITEGNIQWQKAVGDFVNEDEVVAEIETDKTSIPINAPSAGVIESLCVPDDAKVVSGQEIYKLKLSDGSSAPVTSNQPASESQPSAQTSQPEPPPPAPSKPSDPVVSGPVPTQMPPVPPLPTSPISSKPASSVKPTPVTSIAPKSDTSSANNRSETRVKMNRMRLRIAQRLKDAQNTCAMLTTFNEVDMSNVMELRSSYKEAFNKKHGLKLGFMSAFIRASSHALQDQPVINAVIDDVEIVYRDYIDISVAVATPKGLVVPVLRNCENMNYADIEQNLHELGEKARSGNLAVEDMDGGTFTISNGGVFGSMFGTPIINPPQSAILGMHGIFDRPVAVNGKVEIRPMMYVALTYDHRLVDGREAVTFLKTIKNAVEDPRILLLNL